MKYILKNKKPVVEEDVLKWGKWMENGKRLVKQEAVGEFWVSTVFLGIDHNFGNGEPILFETMVFKRNEDGSIDYIDLDMNRYATWEEAIKGHKKMVTKWTK